MGIPDEDVAQVRAATDLVALVGEHVALRKVGRRWSGLCPFHGEKTPSFSVNAELGFYHCFGCQASGDAITFVRETLHLDFVEAVHFLADRAGVTIHETDTTGPSQRERATLYDAMERAVAWYHERLLAAPDAGPARDYLRSRGYTGDTVRRFRLGWAPDDWDALAKALDLPPAVLSDAGLGFVNRRDRQQDAFRARVLFPICDPSGRPVALGGRILPGRTGHDGRSEPKYKNSQESPIYQKRRTLYALNWAKDDIIASEEVVVCEGYTDVIGFFTAGMPRAVATCGTALAEDHFKLLRNFAKRIVLAYDADAAGQAAVARVYEWERRHEVSVCVAALPAGTDPGDLARSDPDALRAAVQQARPFLQFRVDRTFAAADLASAEGRARAADAALQAVAEHPDALVRDQYVMQISDRCRMGPDLVRVRLTEAMGKAQDRPATPPPAAREPQEERAPARPVTRGSDPSAARPALEALRLAVHRPGEVEDRLDVVLFSDDVHRATYLALTNAENLHEAVETAEGDVADLLRRLSVEEPISVGTPLADPVDAVVSQLVRAAVRRTLADLQADVRAGTGDLSALARDTAEVQRLVLHLDDPVAGREAEERLLAWLLVQSRGHDHGGSATLQSAER